LIISQVERDLAARRRYFLLNCRFSASQIDQAVLALASEGAVMLTPEFIVDVKQWRAWLQQAAKAVDAHHNSHPDHVGLPLTDLRRAFDPQLPFTDLFDCLVAGLCGLEFVQAGSTLRRANHRPKLPPKLQSAGLRIRTALAAKPFNPPAPKEMASDALSQQTLRFLIATGEVTHITENVVMNTEAVSNAMRLIAEFIREHGPATTSSLRQALSTSRRVIIPLLEKLDREGYTVRVGDNRALRTPVNEVLQ
jgi:selenocysteine-specific elongation factor